MEPLAYKVNEAATVAGISRSRLYQAIASGDLVATKLGRRTLIRAHDLKAFIAALQVLSSRPANSDAR